MTDAEWRSRIRWVVAHPHRPAVLLVERAGRPALPETDLGDEVWTADATATPSRPCASSSAWTPSCSAA